MKEEILHILRYFALFKHPLTKVELHQFLGVECAQDELNRNIQTMAELGEIKIIGGFIQRNEDQDFTKLRIGKQERALDLIKKSRGYSRIIARFPFVRSVSISGSVSKLSVGEDADLDFFIVTASERLWICRTLLHLFKKLTFITGHENFFCMNYFVDDANLRLPFENFYTALELQTLIPGFGNNTYEELKNSNPWTTKYLPNHEGKPLASVAEIKHTALGKKLLEALFNLFFPRLINQWLMRLTDWKWRKKFAPLNLSDQEYDQALMTRIHISKNHPHDFQKRILEAMEKEDGMEKNVYA